MSKILHLFEKFKSLSLQPQYNYVRAAVDLIRGIIQKPENRKTTYVSFNGGKDATIVLYLTVFAYQQLKIPISQISVLYFEEPNPFQEIEEFRRQMKDMVGFKQIKAQRNFKSALTELKKAYDIEYIIMGSRKTDPYCCKLQNLSPSDTQKGYPEFVRVNPIIDWCYKTVWDFIRAFQIPYCSLYEHGYTYLGNKANTSRNQNLHLGNGKYEPAWMAKEENQCESRANK